MRMTVLAPVNGHTAPTGTKGLWRVGTLDQVGVNITRNRRSRDMTHT